MISRVEENESIKYLRHVAIYHDEKSKTVTEPHAVRCQEFAAKHLSNAADVLELYVKCLQD
jgi:hypothetical protein